MTGILGMVELLSLARLDARQRRNVEVLRDSGRALLALIEDVLDLSSAEFRALRLKSEPFDLPRVCRSVVDGLTPPAREKGLELTLRLADDLPGHAVGDAQRLAQVMRNMIGNAIKWTDDGGVALSVGRFGPAGVLVEVIDTGPGVPEAQRERIFERFARCRHDGQSKEGVGLGLAICRDVVTAMRGECGVKANHPRGARFWFTVPDLVAADAAPEAISAS